MPLLCPSPPTPTQPGVVQLAGRRVTLGWQGATEKKKWTRGTNLLPGKPARKNRKKDYRPWGHPTKGEWGHYMVTGDRYEFPVRVPSFLPLPPDSPGFPACQPSLPGHGHCRYEEESTGRLAGRCNSFSLIINVQSGTCKLRAISLLECVLYLSLSSLACPFRDSDGS